jgi:hypothetical protein
MKLLYFHKSKTMLMGAEASVTLIVVLSIRLYHVPVYGKPVAIALAVTSKKY